jgi:hypothetical protein
LTTNILAGISTQDSRTMWKAWYTIVSVKKTRLLTVGRTRPSRRSGIAQVPKPAGVEAQKSGIPCEFIQTSSSEEYYVSCIGMA